MTVSNSEHLPWHRKLAYGVADLGFSITSTHIGAFFLVFLTDVVGLRPALAGLAILVAKQWDWINDPIIGHISDNTHSRWGRRRPFLLFGFIPFGVIFTLLWWRAPIEQQGLLALYYAGIMVLYDTVATFTYMPYFALTPELTRDYDERTSLTTYRMAFSIIGGLIAFVVPTMIVQSFRPENADRVLVNGALFAVVSALPLLVTFLGTRERPEREQTKPIKLRESIRAAIRNKPFLFSVGIYLFTWGAVDTLSSVLLYYVRYYLNRENISEMIFGAVFIVALIFLPFWNYVSRRSNKRVAYILGIAFWAIVQLILILVPSTVATWAILGLCCLAGIGVSAAHILPWSMIPDAVELDELQTGQRHEGMFYSLVMLAQKAASGIALFLVGVVLDLSGYIANADYQTPQALLAIRGVTGIVPALLLVAGIVFAAFYPINRSEHAHLRSELESHTAHEMPLE